MGIGFRIGLVVALGLATPTLADPAAALRAALEGAPVVAAGRSGFGPSFADLEAAAQVLSAHDPERYARTTATVARIGPLGFISPLQGLAPPELMSAGKWPQSVGFGPADLRTITAWGEGEAEVVRIHLRPGAGAQVPEALLANGYREEAATEARLFRRGDPDFSQTPTDANLADPFVGRTGRAARVLLADDTLTAAWGLTPLQGAFAGPFWAGRDDFTAILDWLSTLPDGTAILRAQVIVTPAALADPLSRGPAPQAVAVGIPPWSLALVAELAAGKAAPVVFAFAYADRAAAEAAASTVAADWPRPGSGRPDGPSAQEIFGPATVAVAGDGPAVVTVLAGRGWSAAEWLENLAFRAALRGLLARELFIFAPAP